MSVLWVVILVFGMVWQVLLLSIIDGIVVDAFSEIRQKTDEAESDRKRRCYLCGIDRSEFTTFRGE